MSTQYKTAAAFLFFAVIFGVTHFGIFPGSVEYFKQVTDNQSLLDLKPEFSAEKVYERLDSFGEEGRAAYLKLIPTIDLIFPISTFIFLLMFGRLAAEKHQRFLYSRYYWVLPSIYILMDFIENLFVALLLVNYPNQLLIASPLGMISVAKRIFMITSFVIPLFFLIFTALRHWKYHHSFTGKNHKTHTR